MAIIKRHQNVTFANSVQSDFRREMLLHLRAFSPELFAIVGVEGFSRLIELGLNKATDYGLTLRGPVRLLLDVMCMLGQNFDRDPQYRRLWPEGDPAMMPMPFADRLHRNVCAYLERCVGGDQALLADAIQAMMGAPLTPSGDVDEFINETLRIVYPQKHGFIGEDNLHNFLNRCREVADATNVFSSEGRTLVALLAFCFGSEFLDNPLYPWVAARLRTDAPEPQRIKGTLSALRIYGEAALKNFRRR